MFSTFSFSFIQTLINYLAGEKMLCAHFYDDPKLIWPATKCWERTFTTM